MPARARPRTPPNRLDPASLAALALFALAYAFVALVRGLPAWTHLLYAGASAMSLVLYAVDKLAARAGRDRIPESVLLWLGLLGGWPGAIVAQQAWRHKTVKRSFRVRFWLTVAANAAVFAWASTR